MYFLFIFFASCLCHFFLLLMHRAIVKKEQGEENNQYPTGALSWLTFKALSIVITEKAYL